MVDWHIKNADISQCGKYRYRLGRIHTPGPWATFVMLNPSTADGNIDDPTIRKCLGFAERWGCGQMNVINLFAARATNPKDMLAMDDPVGPDNKEYFDRICDQHQNSYSSEGAGVLVCAWGNDGTHMDQDQEIMGWLERWTLIKPMCFGVNKNGTPKHPLYTPYNTTLIPYRGRRYKAVGNNTVLIG